MQEDSYLGDINDPLGLNLYTYVHNEPLMYSDPSGHSAVSWLKDNIVNAIKSGVSYEAEAFKELYNITTDKELRQETLNMMAEHGDKGMGNTLAMYTVKGLGVAHDTAGSIENWTVNNATYVRNKTVDLSSTLSAKIPSASEVEKKALQTYVNIRLKTQSANDFVTSLGNYLGVQSTIYDPFYNSNSKASTTGKALGTTISIGVGIKGLQNLLMPKNPSVVTDTGVIFDSSTLGNETRTGANVKVDMMDNSSLGSGENNTPKTQGHHSDPKYLGGDSKQKLTDIETQDHIDIHKEIDSKYPRYKGKSYYDKLRESNPEFDENIQKDISDIYNKYADKYPDLPEDFKNNFSRRNK